MDKKDEHLLALLAENSRASIKTLSAALGLSRTATAERLARLRERGDIEAFTIRRRQEHKGQISALLIKTREPSCEALAPVFQRLPQIRKMQSLAGEFDILLEVQTEDNEQLHQLRETIVEQPQVISLQCSPVLKTHFQR